MDNEEKTIEIKQMNHLHIYALLMSDKPSTFDLQLLTANGENKIAFQRIANLKTGNYTCGILPYLYYLKLPKEADGYAQIITSYYLRISVAGMMSSWHYHEDVEVKQRQWFQVNEVNHQFLFSVDFQRGALRSKPPCNGVSNWDQLWQYTYFIIQQNDLDLYDPFIDQFCRKRIEFEQEADIDSFFHQCFAFLPTIRKALNDDVYVSIILVRMIGLLHVGQRPLQNQESISYIDIMLKSILNKMEQFFNSINEKWWLLVKDGLTNLLYYKFQIYNKSQNNDSITFIGRIPHTNRYQQQIADNVAKKIALSKIKPTQPDWLDLFKMTTDNALMLECLQLANTFTEYINYAERLLNSKTIPNIKEKISDDLKAKIQKNQFQLSLGNIQLLVKTLQIACTDDVRNVLEQSNQLPFYITNYLNSFSITDINQLDLIHQILNEYYNPYLLQSLEKTSYITNTLTRHSFRELKLLREFYIKWFNCFLCDPCHTNSDEEERNFRDLLDNWLKEFTRCLRPYVELIKILDDLVSMLEKSENGNKTPSPRLDIFLENILANYTKAVPNVIRRVNEIGTFVKNEKFINAFKLHFKDKYVQTHQNTMRRMDICSPLYLLLQNAKENPNIKLIVELMEICTDAIKLCEVDIYSDAIVNPDENSFLSVILFEPCFQKFNIHQAAVNELKNFLKRKQDIGLQHDDLILIRKLSREQKFQFDKIWKYVQQFFGQQYSMEKLLNITYKEMEQKLAIKEKVQTCLSTYCKNANDIQQYQSAIDQLTQKLTNIAIKAIQIPDKILQLVQFADVLNPYNMSKAWLNYRQNEQNTTMTTENREETSDKEQTHEQQQQKHSAFSSNRRPHLFDKLFMEKWMNELKNFEKQQPHSTTLMSSTNSCFDILQKTCKLFDLFKQHLESISKQWKTTPIQTILMIFKDIDVIENEMQLLTRILEPNIVPYITYILNYWNTKDYVHKLCKGLNHIVKFYGLSGSYQFLSTLIEMDEKTTGEICYTNYKQFDDEFLKKHPEQTLNVCSLYHDSETLVDFVKRLKRTDMDNLLEAVNDWDESFITTQTIIDFVQLGYFLDSIGNYATDKQRPMTLNDILLYIDTLLKQKEYTNIVSYFQTSLSALPGIQRQYLDLTDKEKSKRTKIDHIMKKSSLKIIKVNQQHPQYPSSKKYDVCLEPHKGEKLYYNNLHELRDSARLIEYSGNKKRPQKDEREQEIQNLRCFVSFVDTIENILNNLNHLHAMGYPTIGQYSKNEYRCDNLDFKQLDELHLSLKDTVERWERNLIDLYQRYPELTYLSGEQFWIIEDALSKYKQLKPQDPAYHLLKYIGIEKISSTEFNININLKPEKRLGNLGKILSEQRKRVIKPSSTPEQSNSTDGRERKVFVTETSIEGRYRAILSLFQRHGSEPAVNQILFCTTKTNWMDVRAFIYRCFYSSFILHQLVEPEQLAFHVQDQCRRLLVDLVEQNPSHKFKLSIVTTDIQTHLINGILRIDTAKIVRDNELLNENEIKEIINKLVKNYHLVSSTIAGLGKTTFIRNHAHGLERNLVKFPITGDSSIDQIGERLLSISTSNAIHFDIGSIENINLLNSILFSLCLFRSYCFSRTIIYLPENTLFYFELESSPFFKLHQDIYIFRYLDPTILKEFNLNDLIHEEARLRYVTRYLYAIEKKIIKDKEIAYISEQLITNQMRFDLIKKYFIQDKDKSYLSWTQLKIFINVFYHLFNGFSNCGYFRIDALQDPQLRMDIIQTFLHSSSQFTSMSVKSVREKQVKLDHVEEIDNLLSNSIVKWDKTQPFTVVFTHSYDPLFVYKTPKDVPKSLLLYFNALEKKSYGWLSNATNNIFTDYNQLSHLDLFFKLVSLSTKYWNKAICPQCFKQYASEESTCTECNGSLMKPKSTDTNHIKQFQTQMGQLLEREYVITPDNYIKMLLVWLRISSDLPVIIMGETGCGKTALINFLCHKILDDELYVFHIHAGVTNQNITDTIKDQIAKAEILIEDARKLKVAAKRLWIFFDEFNTTKNVGLIKEILCERTLLGEPLPSNMVFLAACNPRRLATQKIRFDDNIGIKKDQYEIKKSNLGEHLLYTVVPIPETMIEYIYDYGYLDDATERKYIKTILRTCKNLSNEQYLSTEITNAVCQSQKYLRNIEDVSSVSLRDVARYRLIYNWYHDTFDKRDTQLSATEKIFKSAILSLILCYYFRLRSPAEKSNYINILKKEISFDPRKDNTIEQILQNEQEELINRMREKPIGTAINRALLDNIFVMFVCVLNRIPVILCGKPGCSKTLAIQIIISNLKGKKSNDPYFQVLPELIAVSYQGTKTCTSESIQMVFERAKKYSDAKTQTELLPVIVFDEIGLAELSPHNPLKVLHNELEIENCKYGFVAISNWRLDASKMNRTLYLACPDPTIQDLQLTATTIHKSINEKQYIQLDDDIMNGLAHSYLELCYELKQQQTHENYFGLRDFYSLIKGIVKEFDQRSKELKKNIDNKTMFDIIRKQMKINFDGIIDDSIDGSEYMWRRFCYYTKYEDLINQCEPPSFKKILDHCLTDRSGRYLMLISDSDSLIDYVERYLIKKIKTTNDIRTLIGSQITGDLDSETYDYRILMDVILYAEKPLTLIMRKMDKCYSSLYDLYNQSFSVSGQKKYCRIALGSSYHPKCLVHDEFYCIVLVNSKDVEKSDPPFLNRFEKHVVEFKDLVEPLHLTITQNLLLCLERLLTITIGTKHFIKLQHLFVNFNCDYICNLVIDSFESEKKNEDDVINHCKAVLMRVASSDLPLLLSLQNENKNKEYVQLLEQYYSSKKDSTLCNLFKSMSMNINRQIIYTYTQIYDNINYPKNTNLKIDEVKLASFKTELELINTMKTHFQSDTTTATTTTNTATNIHLLLIRVDYYNDRDHILSLKHHIVNIYNEFKNNQFKYIWIIFHLQRNTLNKLSNDVLFNGWSSIMIENLNDHEQKQIIPDNVLQQPSYEYLIENNLFSLQFYNLFDQCLSKFHYNISNSTKKNDINKRRNQLLDYFYHDQHHVLSDIIMKKITFLIQNVHETNSFVDWRIDLITNATIAATSRSFYDAFQMTIANFYEMYFLLLFSNLEKQALIDSYLFMTKTIKETTRQELYKQIWEFCLDKLISNIVKQTNRFNINEYIEIPLIFNLQFPSSVKEYEIINNIHDHLTYENGLEATQDQAYAKLVKCSFYENHFEDLIIHNECLFEQYYRDQLTILLVERKNRVPIEFVFSLIYNKNSTKTSIDRIKYYLVHRKELKHLLNIFEYGFNLLNKDVEKTLINANNIVNPNCFPLKTSWYYKLIIADNVIYQIPPNTSISKAEDLSASLLFECNGEPFIENWLMNLIELITAPEYIQHIDNIQNILMIYERMSVEIANLDRDRYNVNNLEKLRSMINVLTAILALYNEPSKIFKMICTKYITPNHLNTCANIHAFIVYLKSLNRFKIGFNKNSADKILSKLEIELLKNWVYDNLDNYTDVLQILNSPENDLWKYSGKILTCVEKILKFEIIKTNHGQIAINGPYEQLEQYLANSNKSQKTTKVEHLLSNRMHWYLERTIRKENIDISLNNEYKYFEENLIELQTILNQQQKSYVKLICLISWLKFYAQMYSYALISGQSQHDIMRQIDRLLSNNNSKICSSIKIFIIKQMMYFRDISLEELKKTLSNRNIVWIKPILLPQQSINEKEQNNFILPTPLFNCKDEYIQVSQLFKQFKEINQLENLITQCQANKNLAYSFYLWFIRYYTRFHTTKNISMDISFVQMIENQLQQQLILTFELIGYQFILLLCKNFDNQSYFQLKTNMTDNDVHIRLIALNIFALHLSSKCTTKSTYLNSLLFDANRKMPKNYAQHLRTRCLIGLQPNNNHIVTQMYRVKKEVQQRLNNREISEQGKFIYQCSKNCYFMYYFENCGRPNDRSKCPLCKSDIGSIKRGSIQLLERDPPQIQLSIVDGFRLIDNYINNYNQTNRYGYYISSTQANNSVVSETSEHLQPITYRLLHMFTHTLIMILCDLKFLQSPDDISSIQAKYFREHYQKDYQLINTMIGKQYECQIWLYKIFNHLSDANLDMNGILDTNMKVFQFEKHIEQNFVLPHIQSISNEIQQYRLAYSEFIRENNVEPQFIDYINELVENEQLYPFLNFLTVTRSNNDIVTEFRAKFYLLQYEKLYPMTDYFLKHLSELEQIQYMYPIVNFTNYLLQKYNHRILRNEASTLELDYFIKKDNNDKLILPLFEQFRQAWYELKLNDVQFNCIQIKIDRTQSSDQFSKLRKLAFFLINETADNSSLEILGCLQTLAKLQNNIVNFYKHITNQQTINSDHDEQQQSTIEIQKLKKDHLLILPPETIDTILNEQNGYIVNYEYGKTKEIIYDYDEIETILRNKINRLQLIDTGNFNYFHYQFELYHKEILVFDNIRRNIKQEQLSIDEKIKFRQFLINTNPDDIRKFLGSLDYVFTFLQNSTDSQSTLTIKNFVQNAINNTTYLHPYILNEQQPFANLQVKYVINLYELIEELVFDEIMKNYVKQELTTDVCENEEEKQNIIEKFIRSTYMLDDIPQQLKDPRVWLSVLKRLIIRIIAANIRLDVELQVYIQRADLWNEDLVQYLEFVNIDNNISLQHTYIILEGIEKKLAITNKSNVDSKTDNEPKNLRDWCQAKNEKINPTIASTAAVTTTTAPTTNVTKKKQIRVD